MFINIYIYYWNLILIDGKEKNKIFFFLTELFWHECRLPIHSNPHCTQIYLECVLIKNSSGVGISPKSTWKGQKMNTHSMYTVVTCIIMYFYKSISYVRYQRRYKFTLTHNKLSLNVFIIIYNHQIQVVHVYPM